MLLVAVSVGYHFTGGNSSCLIERLHKATTSFACSNVAALSNDWAAARAFFKCSTAAVQSERLIRASMTLCSAACNVDSASGVSAVGLATGTTASTGVAGRACGESETAQPPMNCVNPNNVADMQSSFENMLKPDEKPCRWVTRIAGKSTLIVKGLAIIPRLISLR